MIKKKSTTHYLHTVKQEANNPAVHIIKSKQFFKKSNPDSFDIKNQRVKTDHRYKRRDVMLVIEKHDLKH